MQERDSAVAAATASAKQSRSAASAVTEGVFADNEQTIHELQEKIFALEADAQAAVDLRRELAEARDESARWRERCADRRWRKRWEDRW